MRIFSLAMPAGACLMGAAAFVSASPAFEILSAAGVLLAAAPVAAFVAEIWRADDPYRNRRHPAD